MMKKSQSQATIMDHFWDQKSSHDISDLKLSKSPALLNHQDEDFLETHDVKHLQLIDPRFQESLS